MQYLPCCPLCQKKGPLCNANFFFQSRFFPFFLLVTRWWRAPPLYLPAILLLRREGTKQISAKSEVTKLKRNKLEEMRTSTEPDNTRYTQTREEDVPPTLSLVVVHFTDRNVGYSSSLIRWIFFSQFSYFPKIRV